MRKYGIISSLLCVALLSCNSRQQCLRIDGYEIDSVVVDTMTTLTASEKSPHCKLSLHLHYLRGEKGNALNDTLLRAGILLPDYFSIGHEKMTVKALADSFTSRYLEEYRNEYLPLYQTDQENKTSYDLEYNVLTHFEKAVDGVLAYVANCYTYGGGQYGIRQCIVLNIDTQKAKIIRLGDLIDPDGAIALQDLIVQQLCKQQDVSTINELREKGFFVNTDVYASDNFKISNKSITFIYGEDEIAPHDMGEVRVEIKRSDFQGFKR